MSEDQMRKIAEQGGTAYVKEVVRRREMEPLELPWVCLRVGGAEERPECRMDDCDGVIFDSVNPDGTNAKHTGEAYCVLCGRRYTVTGIPKEWK